MSAKVENNPDTVTVTIDGREIEAPKGGRIIDVADDHGIDIPRFCYHRKLSVPANCRMCLVDVEMGGKPAPKPLPACATTVNDGMVVRTQSERALKAQKGVMEFLLINHPLDCPICDQGGECELQDVAMGYGRSVSRFVERKRVVEDENLGPLIETEMTRCIHCTRCVRFLDEIAGTSEMGGMFRGEHTEIGTWIGRGVHSEMSGNIIDLCPVGALTSKPYRYRARAWEMLSHPTVAPHDAIGSNLNIHQVRGVIKRAAPRTNEDVNETWISDRDRFGYQGVYAEDRLQRPMIRVDGRWEETDWETALEHTVGGLRRIRQDHGGDGIGALAAPGSTLEELFLLGRLVRGLGSGHIDHRLRQADFRDDGLVGQPGLGLELQDVGRANAVLFVGGNPRHDQPILNHRLRQAARAGGDVMFLNPRGFDWNYEPAVEHVAAATDLVRELALVALALVEHAPGSVEGLDAYTAGASVGNAHRQIAAALVNGERTAVVLGNLVEVHPRGAELRALGRRIAELANASFGVIGHGANAAGGHLAGAVPYRSADGAAASGLDARAMLESPRKAYLLLGLEPEHDLWDPASGLAALNGADLVVAMTPYVTAAMKEYADVLLPVATFSETAGTYVNANGRWQSFGGVTKPVGEGRPAWRLLRVLGNLLELDGFDYNAPNEINAAVAQAVENRRETMPEGWANRPEPLRLDGPVRVGSAAIYGGDPLVRRGEALQQTQVATAPPVVVGPELAERLGVAQGDWVRIRQGQGEARLPVSVSEQVPGETVWLAAGHPDAAGLGPLVGEVTIERA